MIIDCHAHYEPGILDAPGVISRMDEHGIDKTALISRVTTTPIYKKSDYLMGIQRFLLSNKALRPIAKKLDSSFHTEEGKWNPWYRKFIGKSKSYEVLQHPDNQSVFDTVSLYPDRLLGWIFLNPINADWHQEFNKWKGKRGVIGIKIHPFWHRYSLADAYPIAQLAERHQLPLLIHLGFDTLKIISEFVSDNVNTKVIFAHSAFPFYEDIWPMIKKFPNKYVDLSSHHVNRVILKKSVSYLGVRKCLFGTDDPYGDEKAGLIIQKWIKNLNLSSKDEEYILSNNFIDIIKN